MLDGRLVFSRESQFMSPFEPILWRAAGKIECILKSREVHQLPVPPQRANYDVLHALTDQLATVRHRGWQKATESVALQLRVQLLHIQFQIKLALENVMICAEKQRSASQAEIYAELVALASEFEDFHVDLRKSKLSVITEDIVLDDLDLGRFRIILDLNEGLTNATSQPYTVEALSPCCPESRSDITHPHVLRNRLCEGDATAPLRQALRDGRLTDFFQIINQVLNTYNSDSPYASLKDWEGTECHACGNHISNVSSYCNLCNNQVCDDCGTYCQFCEASACDCCMDTCQCCEEACCPNCLKLCTECRKQVCPNCFNFNRICEACDDQSTSETTDTAPDQESDAEITVQSDRLGQVAVLA
jgi:hypothetical protein